MEIKQVDRGLKKSVERTREQEKRWRKGSERVGRYGY